MSKKGFTLIELMIVITLIAILSTIGFAVYSGVQAKARDAKRQVDIDAIAQVLEANRSQTGNTYSSLTVNQFSGGGIPQDTTTSKYCVAAVPVGGSLPGIPTDWDANSPCPSNPSGYVPINDSNPANSAARWRICARLEANTTNPYFCRSNIQ